MSKCWIVALFHEFGMKSFFLEALSNSTYKFFNLSVEISVEGEKLIIPLRKCRFLFLPPFSFLCVVIHWMTF